VGPPDVQPGRSGTTTPYAPGDPSTIATYLIESSLPSSLLGNHTSDAKGERPVTRHHDASGSRRMLEHIVLAAVALDPAFACEPRDHLLPVRLRLFHFPARLCANIGAHCRRVTTDLPAHPSPPPPNPPP